MSMEFGNTFSAVFVIESLRAATDQSLADNPTGSLLHSEILIPLFRPYGVRIENSVRKVRSRSELFQHLDEVAKIVRAEHLHPILQVECHGHMTGITLNNDDAVSWDSLAPFLRAINEASRNTMIVCSSMCWGAYLATTLLAPEAITGRAPFWAVIGPNKEVFGWDMLDGWKIFYTELRSGGKADVATKCFREKVGGASIFLAEHLFALAFQSYILRHMDPRVVDERVNAIAAKCQADGASTVDMHLLRSMVCESSEKLSKVKWPVRTRYSGPRSISKSYSPLGSFSAMVPSKTK